VCVGGGGVPVPQRDDASHTPSLCDIKCLTSSESCHFKSVSHQVSLKSNVSHQVDRKKPPPPGGVPVYNVP